MTGIENEKLREITGGNAVLFSDGQPVCPVCGAKGTRMKIIEQTSHATIYQCELCRQISISESPQKETPITCCPTCGATGAAFKIIADNGSHLRYRCMICGHEVDSVK